MRGVRINLLDCTIHADTVYRSSGEILPAARRAIFGSILSANPRL